MNKKRVGIDANPFSIHRGKIGAGFALMKRLPAPGEHAMKTAFLFIALLLAASAHGQNRLPPGMRPPGCAAGLQLPIGFCATVFAKDVPGARHIVVAPNGDVFVNTQARGGQAAGAATPAIFAFRDTNGDGIADMTERFAEGGGTGIALDANSLYATVGNRIVRYRIAAGSLAPIGKHCLL